MLVMPDQDQLNLGLLAAGACLLLLAVLWRVRRSRSARKNSASAHRTAPAVTSAAPTSEFTTLYDEALAEPVSSDLPAETEPSKPDQADLDQAPDPIFSKAAPETRPAPDKAATTATIVLNDFRKALDDGMDLLAAARKHGLTEDEARVATLCYSPPDA